MTGFRGADPDQLRALSGQMSQGALSLTQIRTRTGTAIEQTQWFGLDRDRFAQLWERSCRPALDRAAAAMQTAAKNLQSQAAEQDAASRAGGAGAAVDPAPTASPPATAPPSVQAAVAPPPAAAAATLPASPAATVPPGSDPSGSDPTGPTATGPATADPAPTGPASAGPAPAAPVAGTVQDEYGRPTGSLSAGEESGGRVDIVSTGANDPGGISYGKFQIATGTMPEYVRWAATHDPAIAEKLHGLTPGTAAFKTEWQAIATADPEAFGRSQYEFISQTHYQPVVRQIESAVPGFTLQGRSPVVAEAVWSMAVQHRGYSAGVMRDALAGKDVASMSDADLVSAMYDERGRDDGRAHFPSSPRSTQHSVAARFQREKAAALDLLSGGR